MMEIVTPETVGISTERLTRVKEWLINQVSFDRVAGASVIIARHGKVALWETTGMSDKEQGKPFEKDTIVRLYSMTKPVTTLAAMMLFEEGHFQMDDPVEKFLPIFADTRVWVGGDSGIENTKPQEQSMTVLNLMTHTSGLTYNFHHGNVVDEHYRQPGMLTQSSEYNLEEWISRLAKLPLIFQPGSRWNYSVSTDILGRLVEIWSGMSLQKFFQERIFYPLGMVDCGFHVKPAENHRFAALYDAVGSAGLGQSNAGRKPKGIALRESSTDSVFLEPAAFFSGGGGLIGTMQDYARFCQMLLNRGQLDGKRLLGRKTVDYMRLNHLPENRDMAAMGQAVWSETTYEGIGFGLGWAVVIDPVKAQMMTSVGEHHWGGAASTFFWIDPDEDLYVIYLSQLLPSSAYPIRRELRSLVYQTLVD